MLIKTVLSLPLMGPRLVMRALEDLHSLAEGARRQPRAAQEITAVLQAVMAEVAAVTAATAATAVTDEVAAQAREIVSGGAELNQIGRVLDAHAAQIADGGQDLVAVARSLDETLTVFRQLLPRGLSSLDTVEDLEEPAESRRRRWSPFREQPDVSSASPSV